MSPRAVITGGLVLLLGATAMALLLDEQARGPGSGCPSGWVETVDPTQHFSVCHPKDVENNGVNDAIVLHPTDQSAGGFSLALNWGEKTGFEVLGQPSDDTCVDYTVMGQVSSEFIQLDAGGRELPACRNEGILEGGAGRLATISAALPLAEDGSDARGYIAISASFMPGKSSSIPTLVQEILDSLLPIGR